MSETMTTCQLRLKAAEEIENRGWHQGNYCGPNGEVCMLGALAYAAGVDVRAETKKSEMRLFDIPTLRQAIEEMGFRTMHTFRAQSVPQWNDAPDRKKEEVLARLRDGCEASR